MKHLKRFTVLLLTFVMALSLSVTAFAADNGSITVNNTVTDVDYTIYRIFDLESYSGDNYSYKVSAKWADYFAEGAEGLDYFTVENGYVTAKEGIDAAAFAKKALEYATTQSIANDGTKKGNNGTIKFDNLSLGYYLVDSSLGALCALTTTKPEATVYEKNTNTSLDKQVKEDSTNSFGKVNDADIGQTVEFKATITVQGYAKDYVMHDKMDDGLTYKEVSKVTLNDVNVDVSNYTVETTGLTDGCTFEVVFTKAFCDTLKSGDKIEVYYTADLNDNAVVSEPENNNAHLSYKDETDTSYNTADSNTKTYTWDVDVLKYANGNESNVLQGAEFVLLNSDRSKVAKVEDGKLVEWVTMPTIGEDNSITWPENTVLTTDEYGKIEIDGLDADTYYLREIKAPAGYNQLAADQDFTIISTEGTDNTLTYTHQTVKINNQSGAQLPETGGMGTTLFYAVGGVLVLGAAVLLVTRKRVGSKG